MFLLALADYIKKIEFRFSKWVIANINSPFFNICIVKFLDYCSLWKEDRSIVSLSIRYEIPRNCEAYRGVCIYGKIQCEAREGQDEGNDKKGLIYDGK